MIVLAPIVLAAAATPAADAAARTAIVAVLEDGAAGWNAGDLDRFMRGYADDAVYVTGKGLVRGRAAIAERYRPSFAAGGNRRGRLTFGDIVFRRIDPTYEMVWARWTLTGAKVETGMTSLLFERRPEGWRIVSDHSS